MSGASARKRILKTSVAAAAAGAVLFAPLTPLAQEVGAPLDPVSIRIGSNTEFTRIEFAGVIGARSHASARPPPPTSRASRSIRRAAWTRSRPAPSAVPPNWS